MLKRIRKFMTDGLLTAVPPGKLLALGRVWLGELKPVLDSGLGALEPLVTGFTSGRVLHAQELSDVTDLGRAWIGDLVSRIRAAARDASSAADPRVDLGPVLSEAERVDTLLRSAAPTNSVVDALHRLRRAADRVGARTADATNPLTQLAVLTPEQRQSGPHSPENRRSREFWARQTADSPGQPTTAQVRDAEAKRTVVRDQLAIAARAKDMRTKMQALNAAALAYHSGGQGA